METWHKQLVRKLFHYSARHMDIEGAFIVKHPQMPSKLYKYRQFSENHVDALFKSTLWASSPDRLNDPHEAEVRFDSDRFIIEDRSPTEFIEEVKRISYAANAGGPWEPNVPSRPIRSGDWIKRVIRDSMAASDIPNKEAVISAMHQVMKAQKDQEIQRMTSFFRQNFSVLSLSATPVSKLLWSHYSNSHKGFAIEYDFGALPYGDLRRRLCFPVFYTSKPRDATLYMARGDRSNFNNLFGQYMLLIKQSDWAYEQEWRIIHAIGGSHANFEIQMPKPSAVIFGSKAEIGVEEKKVIDFCTAEDIPLKRATQRPGAYDLSINGFTV